MRSPSQRKSKYEELIKRHFSPNEDGFSKWMTVPELVALGFKWSKNGNTRRGVPWGDRVYMWEFDRKNESRKGEILALRTCGFRVDSSVKDIVRSDILKEIRTRPFCNFSLLPVPNEDREVDHRWGHKDHPKYSYLNDSSKQSLEDFQLLHHAQNVQKREMCIKCIESRIRPRHPFRDYVEGDQNLDDYNVCSGCFLAEPERYR
jgi:hypothetical protein